MTSVRGSFDLSKLYRRGYLVGRAHARCGALVVTNPERRARGPLRVVLARGGHVADVARVLYRKGYRAGLNARARYAEPPVLCVECGERMQQPSPDGRCGFCQRGLPA